MCVCVCGYAGGVYQDKRVKAISNESFCAPNDHTVTGRMSCPPFTLNTGSMCLTGKVNESLPFLIGANSRLLF